MSKWMLRAALGTLSLGLMAASSPGLVWTSGSGTWPASWPVELESLRPAAVTINVHTGTQEHIYEVTFTDHAEFEKAWPALVRVRTPGSPLKLQSISTPEPGSWASIASNATPKVRIYAPTNNGTGKITSGLSGEPKPAEGKAQMLPYKLGPPWPAELVSKDGGLPEYVQPVPREGKAVLIEVESGAKQPLSFRYRARIDIELFVDGKVIDLNRIKLPDDAKIIDRRFANEPAKD